MYKIKTRLRRGKKVNELKSETKSKSNHELKTRKKTYLSAWAQTSEINSIFFVTGIFFFPLMSLPIFFRLFGSGWVYGRINYQGIPKFDANISLGVKVLPFTSRAPPSLFVQYEISFAIFSRWGYLPQFILDPFLAILEFSSLSVDKIIKIKVIRVKTKFIE